MNNSNITEKRLKKKVKNLYFDELNLIDYENMVKYKLNEETRGFYERG